MRQKDYKKAAAGGELKGVDLKSAYLQIHISKDCGSIRPLGTRVCTLP